MSPEKIFLDTCLVSEPVLTDNEIVAEWKLPPDFIGFAGHFPGSPILPAIYHGILAMALLQKLVPGRLKCIGLHRGKYQQVVIPDNVYRTQCALIEQNNELHAKVRFFKDDHIAVSSFELLLERE